MSVRVGVALLSAMLFVSGCMVGPNYVRPPAQVADQWMEVGAPEIKAEAADYSEWWAIFGDPVLDELVDLAYQQNLPLQIAGVRILQTRAQLGIAVGTFFPQLQELGGSFTRTHSSEKTAQTRELPFFERDFNQWDFGFDAAWELDFWGKFRRGIESANANALASIANYDDVLVSLVAEVAAVYVNLRTLEERLRLALNNVQIQERSLQIVDVQFQNGAVTELDVQQATSLLKNTESLIPEFEARIRQTQNALSVLLGQPPRSLNDLLGGPQPIPAPPPEVAVGIPAELLRRRPDIRRAEREMAAQSAQIGVAKAVLFPAISISGAIGFTAEDIDDMFQGRSFEAFGGPAFNWPVLNYGRLTNNVRVQDARFQELVVNYQNTVLVAAQEVEDALIGYLRAQDQATFLAEAVAASERAVELSLIQYRDGAIDYQRVLDSQQGLVTDQDNLAVTQGNIVLNLVSLYKALGGGWELRSGQAFVRQAIQTEMRERTNWGRLLPEDEDVPPEDREERKKWWWPFW
jgi:NodT family efflux transporter outer membrane factor (OMF) lipoprotein